MKNLKLYFLLLLFTTSFIACKKKDEQIDVKVGIIGKWQLQSSKETYYINGVKEEEYTSFSSKEHIEFTANGTAIFDDGSYTYQIEGNNRLLLTYGKETTPEYNFEIVKITANELVLSTEKSRTAKNGDVSKTVTELTFTK